LLGRVGPLVGQGRRQDRELPPRLLQLRLALVGRQRPLLEPGRHLAVVLQELHHLPRRVELELLPQSADEPRVLLHEVAEAVGEVLLRPRLAAVLAEHRRDDQPEAEADPEPDEDRGGRVSRHHALGASIAPAQLIACRIDALADLLAHLLRPFLDALREVRRRLGRPLTRSPVTMAALVRRASLIS